MPDIAHGSASEYNGGAAWDCIVLGIVVVVLLCVWIWLASFKMPGGKE